MSEDGDKVVPLANFNERIAPPVEMIDGKTDAAKEICEKIQNVEGLTSMLAIGFNDKGVFVSMSTHMSYKDALWLIETARKCTLE